MGDARRKHSRTSIILLMVKTEYILGLLESVERQAAASQPFNTLKDAIAPIKARMENKKALGLNPTEEKAPAVIASVRAAIAAYEAKQIISTPTDEEILAGLAAAEDDTPTEL